VVGADVIIRRELADVGGKLVGRDVGLIDDDEFKSARLRRPSSSMCGSIMRPVGPRRTSAFLAKEIA
jgi:hypothetical protein